MCDFSSRWSHCSSSLSLDGGWGILVKEEGADVLWADRQTAEEPELEHASQASILEHYSEDKKRKPYGTRAG